jgi:hypothetical protein
MKLNDIIQNAYIYKIHSNDNKMNYYGITTQTPNDRFKQHIDNYYEYTQNNNTIQYCSSFIIFTNYTIQQTQIQIIEHRQDITLREIKKREKYYIQNFDCVNIYSKKYTNQYTTLDKQIISQSQIQQIIKPTNITQQFIDFIQIFGLHIQDHNIHIHKHINFNQNKNNINHKLQQLYNITPKSNQDTLFYIDLIFNNHSLQLIINTFYNLTFINYKLKIIQKIQPLTFQLQQLETLETFD